MRCAMEAIAVKELKLIEAKEDLKKEIYSDTIKFCEEILDKTLFNHFSNINFTTSSKCCIDNFDIYEDEEYGIKFYNCKYKYKVDAEILYAYLAKYCYSAEFVYWKTTYGYRKYSLYVTIDPKCLAN